MSARKFVVSFLVILTVIFTACVVTYAENLLPNSGLETDSNSDGIPDSWNKSIYSGTPTVQMDAAQYYEGTKSVKMVGTDAANDRCSIGYLVSNASSMNGLSYKFSIYQKTEAIVSNSYGTAIRINFLDDANQIVKPHMYISGTKGTTDWTKVEVTFTVPYGTTKFWIEPFLWFASGTVWWDEVELVPENLFQNPGFETDSNSDGIADNWINAIYSGTPTLRLDTAACHAGAKSQKITGVSTADRAAVKQSFNVSQLNGLSYKFSVYQKTENIAVSNPSDYGTCVRISFLDANNQAVVPHLYIAGSKGTVDWTKIETTITIPQGTVTLIVEPFLWFARGTVWWDDMQMQSITSSFVSDPGFENDSDSDGVPYSWVKTVYAGNPAISMDSTIKHRESKSIKITGDSGDDRGSISQELRIPSGVATRLYKLTAWAKTDNITSTVYGSVVRIEFISSAGESAGDSLYIPGPKGTEDWTKIENTFLIPEGTAVIRINLFMWLASGTVWWDDAEVIPVELLANKRFETDANNDNVPDGWTTSISSGTPAIILDTAQYYDGVKSVKMTGTSQNDFCRVSQTVSLPEGHSNWGYKVSINHRVDNLTSANYGTVFRVYFRNDSGQLTGSEVLIRGKKGTHDWTKIEKTIAIPYGTTKLVFEAFLWYASGTVWWDLADITPVELLSNREFETDTNGDNLPDDWSFTVTGGNPTAMLDTTDYYYDGLYNFASKAVKLTGTSLSDKGVLSQTIKLSDAFSQGGRFSVFYKTKNIVSNSGGIFAKITFLDSGGTQTGNAMYIYGNRGSNSWIKLQGLFIPPAAAKSVKIELNLWLATGTVWWDLGELVPVPCSSAESPVVNNYGMSFMQGRPVLSVATGNNTAECTLQYSQDSSFVTGTTTVSDLTSFTHTVSSQLAEGTWYARAAAVDTSNSTTSYGPVTKFFVQRLIASPNKITPNSDGANDTTVLSYDLQDEAAATLEIFDLGGNRVRILVNNQSQDVGLKNVLWDGKNDSDILVANGRYTARLTLDISGNIIESDTSVTVDANDTSGFSGLENNKDWSGFYDDWIEKVAVNIADDFDSSTGRYTRVLTSNPAELIETAGYSFIMADAYHRSNSSFYNNTTIRDRAISVFDYVISREAGTTGSWFREIGGDPNSDRFTLALMAEAYMLLQDDVDATKRTSWLQFLRKAAQYQMDTYSIDTALNPGDYPNQDANYVLLLGLIGTVDNNFTFLNEADRMLDLMQDDLYRNGGFSYILDTNPSYNYQHFTLSFLGRYYEITGNSDVLTLLQNAIDYYPATTQLNGFTECASSPELKQYWLAREMPGGADTIAFFSGDGKNKMVANIIKEKLTNLYKDGWAWTNETYLLYTGKGMYSSAVTPVRLGESGLVKDPDISGFRGRWGNFTATLTNTKVSNTLASATLFNGSDVFNGVDSSIGWVYFESKDGDADGDMPRDWAYILPPNDTSLGDTAGQTTIVKQSVYESNIGVQFTQYIPTYYYGWKYAGGKEGDWKVKQTWILFKNRLIGMFSMKALTANSNGMFARSRLVFGPATGKTLSTEIAGNDMYGNYGGLGFWLNKGTSSGWSYTTLANSAEPMYRNGFRAATNVALQKDSGNWNEGDSISYNAVYFPLGNFTTAKDWHDDTNANNIAFSDLQPDVHAAQINANDGTGVYYAIISNHADVANTSHFAATLPDGNYTLTIYTNDTGTPDSTQNITVTNGSYSLNYNLAADSVAVYKLTPR